MQFDSSHSGSQIKLHSSPFHNSVTDMQRLMIGRLVMVVVVVGDSQVAWLCHCGNVGYLPMHGIVCSVES